MNINTPLIAEITTDDIFKSDLDWVTQSGTPYKPIPFSSLPEHYWDDVFAVYENTYKPLGQQLKNKYRLSEYDRWILIKQDDVIVAAILLKTTKFGVKLGFSASNGQRISIKAMLTFLTNACRVEGFYAEISPPLEKKLIEKVPSLSSETAEHVLGRKLNHSNDGLHYHRDITGIGAIEKIMVGRPLLPAK